MRLTAVSTAWRWEARGSSAYRMSHALMRSTPPPMHAPFTTHLSDAQSCRRKGQSLLGAATTQRRTAREDPSHTRGCYSSARCLICVGARCYSSAMRLYPPFPLPKNTTSSPHRARGRGTFDAIDAVRITKTHMTGFRHFSTEDMPVCGSVMLSSIFSPSRAGSSPSMGTVCDACAEEETKRGVQRGT